MLTGGCGDSVTDGSPDAEVDNVVAKRFNRMGFNGMHTTKLVWRPSLAAGGVILFDPRMCCHSTCLLPQLWERSWRLLEAKRWADRR